MAEIDHGLDFYQLKNIKYLKPIPDAVEVEFNSIGICGYTMETRCPAKAFEKRGP
jgi:hypothetical protein